MKNPKSGIRYPISESVNQFKIRLQLVETKQMKTVMRKRGLTHYTGPRLNGFGLSFFKVVTDRRKGGRKREK